MMRFYGPGQPTSPVCAAPPSPQMDSAEAPPRQQKDPKPLPEPVVAETTEQKYQYKEEQRKTINPEAKKCYDREFLLGLQFNPASMHKPEGLPTISGVILDQVNKTPLRPADPARLMNACPEFTPSYWGNRSVGGPQGPPPGPRRTQQGQQKEPRKIIVSMNVDVQLNKAENAWKPSLKKSVEEDPEVTNTQEVLKRLRSILNKLTPEKFQNLMKQVTELPIDTEEKLKGAVDLIFEKAIMELSFSVAYANMCRRLMDLKVPTAEKPGATTSFRKLLLSRCQKEFEKSQDDDILEMKQKALDAANEGEERDRLKGELDEARGKARRRPLGNIKFIGELFKQKMLTEAIVHDCVVTLLKKRDEESLECLCKLLSTIGKELDFEKAKSRMDKYFTHMAKIIKERTTSSRIRFMLQDVWDLRMSNWVPRRGDQGPKTLDQIHKEAELEEHREQIKVQQQLMEKKESGGRTNMGGQGSHTPGGSRNSQPQDEGMNTVPISKNRPIDISKITKLVALDNLVLAPKGTLTFGTWAKGCSRGSGTKPASGEKDSNGPATITLKRLSALQSGSLSSSHSDRRVPQRSSSSQEPGLGDRENCPEITKRSFSRESQEHSEDGRSTMDSVPHVASKTDDRDRVDRGSRDRVDRGSKDPASSKDLSSVKRDSALMPPPSKPGLSEEQLEKKSNAIIEEYLDIKDLKEALECVEELNSASLLFVFVRVGFELTLERKTIARENVGRLMHHLIKAGTLPPQQYYKGLHEILEVAEDMEIDIPLIWRYLAELITPVLDEGGLTMGQLFREISKPLVSVGKAGVLLVQVLNMLCKGMTPMKVRGMWTEAGLNWKDFLPSDEDVHKFVTDQKLEHTLEKRRHQKTAFVEMIKLSVKDHLASPARVKD